MQIVKGGKLYDTEKAKKLCTYEFGYHGEFDRIYEELYITEKGNFFMYGEGGAQTRYATSDSSNSWSYGSDMFPLTQEEAYLWAEKTQKAEDLIKLFPDLVEEA